MPAAHVAALLLLLGLPWEPVEGREQYTTNAICLKRHCINPIFPALEDLGRLQGQGWQCSSLQSVAPSMRFCRDAVNYDPALPGGNIDIVDKVKKQDSQAATMFMYHLSGMGLEAWDYMQPERSDDDCVKSVWRMVCYTYFPRAQIGCREGVAMTYQRPCKSCCQNYIRACGVECCDESVRCVFEHTKFISKTDSVTTAGYLPHDGPSSLCTGSAWKSQKPGALPFALLIAALLWTCDAAACSLARLAEQVRPGRLLPLGALLAVAVSLHGCDYDVPSHTVGNWRAEQDYLIKFQFVPPGGSPRDALLNSCALDGMSPTMQCNGRGLCKIWDQSLKNPTMFCVCERDWADPECSTRRKSQVVAWLYALFFGWLGADHFYLGFFETGFLKLCTLGGAGIWWIIDIIRIGSAPVPSRKFLTAADLPHYIFVVITVSFAMFVGWIMAYCLALWHQLERRKDAMMHSEAEEAHAAAVETKHLPHRQKLPDLRVGDPGMQLKFRPSPTPQAASMVPPPMPLPNYGAVQEFRPDKVSQIVVPRGTLGPPRTVFDGGELLGKLDINNDGEIDDYEAQRLAPGAAVVGPFQPVVASMPPSQLLQASMLRSQQNLQAAASGAWREPPDLGSNTRPRPVASASLPAPAATSGFQGIPPFSSLSPAVPSSILPSDTLVGTGANLGASRAGTTSQLPPARVRQVGDADMGGPPLMPLFTASSMQSMMPPSNYRTIDMAPPGSMTFYG